MVLVNKWDAIEKDNQTMATFTEKVREDLKFLSYVPVVFNSALTANVCQRCCPRRWRLPKPVAIA